MIASPNLQQVKKRFHQEMNGNSTALNFGAVHVIHTLGMLTGNCSFHRNSISQSTFLGKCF